MITPAQARELIAALEADLENQLRLGEIAHDSDAVCEANYQYGGASATVRALDLIRKAAGL